LTRPVDFFFALACFPLSMAVASFAGAHVAHPNLRIIWTPLANAATAGACLGIGCGVLCTVAYKLFHPDCNAHTSADRAFDVARGPLFWIGLANGALIGALTITTFRGALIYAWPMF
jgi:hypothetical protein